MPDQKRQSLGQWLMLIVLKTSLLFPKGCRFQSSNARIWVPCLGGKKVEKGQKGWGDEWDGVPPFFCTYLFIVIYYGSSAEILLWDQTLGWERRSQSLTRSCIAQKIFDSTSPCNLTPFSIGRVSFGDSSSNAFFAHSTPVRYCNNTGTFHPPGSREGNRAKKKSGR